jgi:hypothetical protein
MPRNSLTRTLPVLLSLTLLFAPVLQAEEVRRTKTASPIMDVSLTPGGNLEGRLVNAQGRSVDGARVAVWRGDENLGHVLTDGEGAFTVRGMQSGLYRLDAPGQSVALRVWPADVAPPAARNNVTMVAGDPAVRGQFGMFDPVNVAALALGITGVTLGALTLSQVNDNEKKLKEILEHVSP